MKIHSLCLGVVLASSFLPSALWADTNVAQTSTNPCTSPAEFNYDANATLIAKGTYGTGSAFSLGAGTRFMWYPKRAAFRAGYVSSTQWDDASIGNYSVAMGNGSIASGNYSAAFGLTTSATGSGAAAFGENTVAEGQRSFAFGYNTMAHGGYSLAGEYYCQAVGGYSTALGNTTYAAGTYSTALGLGTRAGSYAVVAIGTYNVGSGNSYTTADPTDPIFEVGNGTAPTIVGGVTVNHRSNALTLDKSGNLTVSTVTVTATPVAGDIPMFGH